MWPFIALTVLYIEGTTNPTPRERCFTQGLWDRTVQENYPRLLATRSDAATMARTVAAVELRRTYHRPCDGVNTGGAWTPDFNRPAGS